MSLCSELGLDALCVSEWRVKVKMKYPIALPRATSLPILVLSLLASAPTSVSASSGDVPKRAAAETVLRDVETPLATMCAMLQHSTMTSLLAIQDMGLELSEILIEDWNNGGGESVLNSKVVLDQGLESFHKVLRIAQETQVICRDHYEPNFVATLQALS